MSENKEYFSRADDLGNIHISEEVLASIAAAAALEVEGVAGMAAHLAERLGKSLTRGVHVKIEETYVTVDVSILMAYGATIPEVAKAVQENVKTAVESMTALQVAAVNVNVAGVVFPPKTDKK